MKKLSQFAALFVLLASFTTPILAIAQTQSCAPGYTGTDCSIRIPGATTGVQSGSGVGLNTTYLDFYYYLVLTIVNSYLIPILFAVAFIVFLYGIYKYFIQEASSESDKADGRKFAMWGIIGFIIISSVWGLVNLVGGTIVPSAAGTTHPNYPRL